METIDTMTAILICEGCEDSTQELYMRCWQHLIDTGVVWQLRGWFGRTANYLIENGYVHHKVSSNTDVN